MLLAHKIALDPTSDADYRDSRFGAHTMETVEKRPPVVQGASVSAEGNHAAARQRRDGIPCRRRMWCNRSATAFPSGCTSQIEAMIDASNGGSTRPPSSAIARCWAGSRRIGPRSKRPWPARPRRRERAGKMNPRIGADRYAMPYPPKTGRTFQSRNIPRSINAAMIQKFSFEHALFSLGMRTPALRRWLALGLIGNMAKTGGRAG